MSKSAILPLEPFDGDDSSELQAQPAWKQEVNQRLAAHRSRRPGAQGDVQEPTTESPKAASSRASAAAARVAARYAKAPSYSELLAGEARAVVRAASAAAEAARGAQAAAEAVLAGLESGPVASGLWEPAVQNAQNVPAKSTKTVPGITAPPVQSAASRWQDEPPAESVNSPWAGAQPRWEEALPVTAPAPAAGHDVWSEMKIYPASETSTGYGHELDEGELFPDANYGPIDAIAGATVEPVQHLPANLIQFPRELVATRKARPRQVETPYYNATQDSPQLSIFEVDPEFLVAPIFPSAKASETVAPPEWASIELEHTAEPAYDHFLAEQADASAYVQAVFTEPIYELPVVGDRSIPEALGEAGYRNSGSTAANVAAVTSPAVFRQPDARVPERVAPETVRKSVAAPVAEAAMELLVAPMADRLLATVVDTSLVVLAFLGASVVVIASTTHPPTGHIALIAASIAMLVFALLYQFLFLSYAEEGTPGMRYARIALCTFDDDNPTLEQMRMRIPALLLSALPLGLGVLWALIDGNHLAWHDRLTKTYQRKY